MNESVANLAALWRSIDDLCSGLTEEEWKRPTGCPGWSVQDNLSHLIDYEAGALGRERPDHEVGDAPHLKNDLAKANEVGVDYRRTRPGAEVLDEFREVTAARLEQLGALSDEDLTRPMQTPAGDGTLADMLVLRVMDTWSHEQDMRRALGRPGATSSPAAEQAIQYFCRVLPFVVGKRAGAPEGSSVVFHIGDRAPIGVAVVEGRGRVADELPQSPTVELRMPVEAFAALVGGRSDADPSQVSITGDEELGGRVVGALAIMP